MNKSRQRGVALITAMIITAIAVSIAATLVYKQQLSIRLAGNIGSLEQAYQYAIGMEDWSGIILSQDLQDSDIDALNEDWATELPPIPIPGGMMTGRLFDLQARFNVNDLIIKNPDSSNSNEAEVIVEHYSEALKRLLLRLEILNSDSLVDSLADWIDQNDYETTNGAESRHYQSLDIPYLAANGPLVSPSEIQLIKGFTEKVSDAEGTESKIYDRVKPFLTTLPNKALKINVNTADFNVLYALGEGLDEEQINAIITDREEDPFANAQDFIASLQLAEPEKFPIDLVDVRSSYFLLEGLVEIGRTRVFLHSIIHRDNTGRTRVISREFIKQG
ncbi:MAG: General secretion pathway protein K [uncultured Thiotrichaceae bacterium]|uniref:Type II secretion system protein K n=1 Tax=uncultured Thiotrichaceae bacterium TaxID=298394 RepID=A0A6S6SPD7_9GAMM|nr:MAG: General secretion pathway protein K [uncultured Thiotrichaceae bacterium]